MRYPNETDTDLRDLIENVPQLEIVQESIPRTPLCWEPERLPVSPEHIVEVFENLHSRKNRGRKLTN